MGLIDFFKTELRRKKPGKNKLDKKLNRKKKGDEREIDEESDYPVHEKYTKEEPVKE